MYDPTPARETAEPVVMCMCFAPDCVDCWGEDAATPEPELPEHDLGGEG